MFADYNRDHHVTPELDARFAALAAQRMHAAPLRYYVWLPAAAHRRHVAASADGALPSDTRWWEFNDDGRWLAVSLALGVINLLYLGAAAGGFMRGRAVAGIGLLVLFVVVRSAFLGTLENPEPRYTLEAYPVVIALASALFASIGKEKA